MNNKDCYEKIEQFMVVITKSAEYQSIKYLIFSIRKLYLDYLSGGRLNGFTIPSYLEEIVQYIDTIFEEYKIDPEIMLDYMLKNDNNNWVHYYYHAFMMPPGTVESSDYVKVDRGFFILILTGYILDRFRDKTIDIQDIIQDEKMIYSTNQYGLTIVNNVDFQRDYFIFEEKAYLYNTLTDTQTTVFGDSMPGFARIITEQVSNGDILLRLDERLALPKCQAISYSTLNFDKFRGPQFRFNDTKLEKQKTITVHIDPETYDKLLMVIKKDYDEKLKKSFLHVEIETLPYIGEKYTGKHYITTFLHGMYYIDDDCFRHIDYAKNQYAIEDYISKYGDVSPSIPIDFYAKKKLHYKVWCVENGNYSRKVWYNLMIVSLPRKYRILLDEMLAL